MVERSDQLRFSINTGRADIVQRLNKRDTNADSMDWSDLRERVATGTAGATEGSDKSSQSASRSLGCATCSLHSWQPHSAYEYDAAAEASACLLTLIVVIVYYLISLLGESLARVGTVSPYVGPWLATVFIFGLSLLFLLVKRVPFISSGSILHVVEVESTDVSQQRPDNIASRLLGVGLSKPDGCDALSLAGVSFLVCFRRARRDLQHLHAV